MLSAFKSDKGIRVGEMQLRPINSDEIRIKVDACGVCGTDLLAGDGPAEESQFGHEVAGTVLEIGSMVPGLSIGQKVAMDSASACGRCENCKNTKQELCTNVQSFFLTGTFGFAEEMIAP